MNLKRLPESVSGSLYGLKNDYFKTNWLSVVLQKKSQYSNLKKVKYYCVNE
mgnify:CR=1 FL=1